jgi:hypothetical protein
MLPKSTNGDIDEGYCDYGRVGPSSISIFMRSGSLNDSYNGVSYLHYVNSNNIFSYEGSRLAYTGELNIVTNFR